MVKRNNVDIDKNVYGNIKKIVKRMPLQYPTIRFYINKKLEEVSSIDLEVLKKMEKADKKKGKRK